jgi:hypothetical protein
MKLSVEGITVALCVLAFTHCGGQDARRVLIASGDAVRILSAPTGACPGGWNQGNFNDSNWTVAQLPFFWSTGACMRARFDVGNDLQRYRWLKIALGASSQAHLTLIKDIGLHQGQSSLDWTTNDGEAAAATMGDVVKTYTLDLMLFPDLLQARENVLALQFAESTRSVSVTAELDVDEAKNDPFVHAVKGPYTVRPTAGPTTAQARVVWETSTSAPSWVLVDHTAYDGGWAVHHEVPINGLMPEGIHSVYVESAEASALPRDCAAAMIDNLQSQSHRAPLSAGSDPSDQLFERRDLCQQLEAAIDSNPAQLRPAGNSETVRLLVLGNSRAEGKSAGGVFAAAEDIAVAEGPDLIVHTGDMVSNGGETNWQSLFDHAQPLLRRAPIAPAIGERDTAFGLDRFGQLFSVPPLGDFGHAYSVDEGVVHVALLDSTANLSNAATWLDSNLRDAEVAGARHLFVVLHQGPWSAGPAGGSKAALGAIVPVARRHHVDAILSGHDSIYEHGVVDGLHYFVSGGGGDTVDQPLPLSSTVTALAAPHYLVIDVSGTTAHVQAKNVAGQVLDDVTLQNQ